MLKKITLVLSLIACAVIFAVGEQKFSSAPPPGNTGQVPGNTCARAGCHTSFPLNSGGGNITTTLPDIYTAGSAITFNVIVADANSTTARWGFSIKAVIEGTNTSVGTFEGNGFTANLNPSDNSELSHQGAFPATASAVTFLNLKWTPPAGLTQSVRFFYAGNAANGNSNPLGDYIYSGAKTLTAAPVTPVELKDFTLTVKSTAVELKWSTLSEQNSKEFIIERSNNNQHFYPVGKVAAAGNSNELKQYQFIDNTPEFNKNLSYRLLEVDIDGQQQYSKVLTTQIKAATNYVQTVYPSPALAGGQIAIHYIADEATTATVELFSVNGRKLRENKVQLSQGKTVVTYQLNKLIASGQYFLVVTPEKGSAQKIPVLIK